MIKTISGSVWRILQPTARSTALFGNAPSCLSSDLSITLKSTQFCYYCTKNHTQSVLSKKFNKVNVHKLSPSSGSSRFYASDSKLKSVDTASKIPLAKTATVRRQRKKTVEEKEELQNQRGVVAYAVGEELDIDSVKERILNDSVYDVVQLPKDIQDVLMVTAKYKVDDEPRDAFFFRDGSTAFWNMSEAERHVLMKFARKHAANAYNLQTILEEVEKMPVVYDKTTKLVKDTIHLKTLPEDTDTSESFTLQKLAFSNALAQSVALSINECNLEVFIEQLEPETQKLRSGQKSTLGKRNINMRLGEVFSLRHQINLESGFLDTPDIYWEREDLEMLYRETLSHLNVPKRIRVLNERLNYCSEILQLFNHQLNDEHHIRLEWIIIILIMIEVVFECIHYAEKLGFISLDKRES